MTALLEKVAPAMRKTSGGMAAPLHGRLDMAKGTCTIEECNKPTVGRGLCRNHYEVARRRHGDDWKAERNAQPTTCSITLCEEKVLARGWCSTHYQRWLNHDDPELKLNMRGESAEDRFLAKILINENGCWLWLGHIGIVWPYGYFSDENGQTIQAHLWAYRHWIGEIPEGKELDHFFCDVKHCVNPHHVRPVSKRENVLRANGPTAMNAAKMECIYGHSFDEENTKYDAEGNRHCRECERRRHREHKARLRQGRASIK